MKKITLLSLLIAFLFGGGNYAKADELTVYDGMSTNEYIPTYGYYVDTQGTLSEFYIPASDLKSIDGATLTALKFYSSNSSISWGTAQFKVYVKEVVDGALNTAFSSDADATTVYEGSLSIASNEMNIPFTNEYSYGGGNLLVGIYVSTKGTYQRAYFYGTGGFDNIFSRYRGSASGNGSAQYFIPKTTITYESAAEGPALKVSGYKDGDALSFGMVDPGTTKTITLVNPGTEDITVNIATTGDFTTDIASATIAANKGEQVVTITAPNATSTGTITITPTATGVDAITLNLSATIKDPSKMFVDFNDNALPEGWATAGVGSYTTGSSASSYVWDFSKGYAWYKKGFSYGSANYYHSLVSPLIKFTDGEELSFKVMKEGEYTSTPGYLRIDYTTDGTTWTAVDNATFEDASLTSEWAIKSVAIPSTAKQIRFVAMGVSIDDIYGGELSTAPVMKVTASDHVFGMISADEQTTFTVANTGKSVLTDVEITSSDANFTISGDYASVGVGETATVTVTMSAATLGAHSGVITVTAPDQETATFNVSGYVMDNTLFTETFDGNALPDGWTNTGWTFANGEASGSYNSNKKQLITPALVVAEGEKMAIEVQKTRSSGCAMDIYVSKDGGAFTKHMTIADADLENGIYKVFFIEGLEAGSYKIRFDANDNKINAVNGFHLNQNAPVFEMVTTGAAAFGKVTASASKTYTVKNAGTGTLTVDIASDNATDFTVAPAQLNIAAGETADFTITFNYIEGSYGNKAATVTATPTYNESLAYTIAATAKTTDPNAWDEDFEEGTLPTGWVANNWTVGTYSGWGTQTNSTVYALASQKGATLITPRLEAKAGQVLTWEADCDYKDEGIKVEYSDDDKVSWKVLDIDGLTKSTKSGKEDFYLPEDNGYSNGAALQMSFTAPADGYYYLRFTSSYSREGVDNFNGFKLALKEHDASITSQNIRSTFSQYGKSNVSVTVKELLGKEETLTAKFFIGETQYGEDAVETVEANGEKTFTVSVTLDEIVIGDAYFTVTNEDIKLISDKVTVTTKPAIVLDEAKETDLSDISTSAWQDVVALKYNAKSGWNTICVPFQLLSTDLENIFGEGYKAYEFKGNTNGELKFEQATRFSSGFPYIVYSENPTVFDEKGYVQTTIKLEKNAPSYDGSEDTGKFQGTFAPIAAPNMQGKYGVTPAGKIQKGGANASLKGYRAYFELPADVEASGIKLNFDGDVITGIEAVEVLQQLTGDVYDMQGRKLQGTNLKKGVYIKDGKKVVFGK